MQGKQGTQSGPVEESTSAMVERLLQELMGWGVGGVGGAAGMAAGSSMGPAGTFAGGTAGVVPGVAMISNANNPNLQDVTTHQLVQAIRRSARGLPK